MSNKTNNRHESNSIARVLLAYSAGEVEGILGDNILKNVYLGETPVMDDNGNYNFTGVTAVERFGTTGQSAIKGFKKTTSVIDVNQQLTKDQARTVTVGSNVDSVRVVLSFPQIYVQDDGSDTEGATVAHKFEVKDTSGANIWEDRGTHDFTTKSFNEIEVDYEIEGPETISGAWQVRVTRLTNDSDAVDLKNDSVLKRVVEIRESKETYPDVALLGLTLDIGKFGDRIPQIAVRCSGIKVRVPDNYYESLEDAQADGGPELAANKYPLYDGAWSGSFKWRSTSNPVWHVYNLISNGEYGAGVDRSYVSKFDLNTIARYCDAVKTTADANGHFTFEGVEYTDADDGNKTKKRRRFTINTQLTDPENAMQVLNNIASSYRGMTFYGAGSVQSTQDSPKSRTAIITNENIVGGRFKYGTTDWKGRFTIARVAYNERDDFFKTAYAQYPAEDDIPTDAGIKRYGRNVVEAAKFGCDNYAEAAAYAKWLVYTSLNETHKVVFSVMPEHARLQPGQVFEIYDRVSTKEDMGGRLAAGSTSQKAKLDRPVTLNSGQTYQITLKSSNGVDVVTRSINNSAGTHDTIFVNGFGFTPTKNFTWAIKGTDIQPRKFRVLTIEKKTPVEYEVVAVEHDDAKYAAVEKGKVKKPTQYLREDMILVKPPTNILFKRRGAKNSAAGNRNDLICYWTKSESENVTKYTYSWRRSGEQWSTYQDTKYSEFIISNIVAGYYEVRIFATNSLGKTSLEVFEEYEVKYEEGDDLPTIYPPKFTKVE